MHRRALLTATVLSLPFLAVACSSGPTGTLAMAQRYGADLADALSAGAAVFLAGPPAPAWNQATIVSQAVTDIQMAKAVLLAATAPNSASGAVNDLLAAALKLSPLVMTFLGAAAPYVPLAIDVLQAFVDNMAPPPVAPPMPPPALHRMALQYHGH